MLVAEYGGEVPARMEDLVRLPGVGRKTANIVLYHAFGRTMGSPSTPTSSGSRSGSGSRTIRIRPGSNGT